METYALVLVQMTVMLLLTISVSVRLISANSVVTGINLRNIFFPEFGVRLITECFSDIFSLKTLHD